MAPRSSARRRRNCISRCFATVVSIRSAKCPLWPGRSGPLSSLISGSFASASPPAVASAGAPPPLLQTARRVPPDLPLPQDRGEYGPPRVGGGRNSRRQGCLRRRTGPGTWLSPPSPRLFSLRNSLPWLNASLQGQGLAFAPSERPPGHAGSPRDGADPAGAWRAGQAPPFQPPRPRLPAAAAGGPRTAAQVAQPRQAGAAERGPRERGGLGRTLRRLPGLPSPPTRPSRLASASVPPSRLEAKATGPGRRR